MNLSCAGTVRLIEPRLIGSRPVEVSPWKSKLSEPGMHGDSRAQEMK